MTALFGPILAAALMAQFQGGTLQSTVVDDQGKPIAGARGCFPWPDTDGRQNRAGGSAGDHGCRGRVSARRAGNTSSSRLSGAGLGVSTRARDRFQHSRRVNAASGAPQGGVTNHHDRGARWSTRRGQRVAPRTLMVAAASTIWNVPESLAEPLAVTTGQDGQATLDYVATGDTLVAVRITVDSIGTQDLQIVERLGRDHQGAAITIRLKPTSRLAGRVRTRAGEPVVGQTVEVWFRGGTWLVPNPVVFERRAHSHKKRRFIPDAGQPSGRLRLSARGAGTWKGDDPVRLDHDRRQTASVAADVTAPLRTVNGRVVDRQRMPLAGIEVFQSGDGPEWTSTRTGADGRFALSGFHEGSVFVFARGEGFRFSGRLVKAGEHEVTLELTGTGERPAHEMRMLPELIPPAESRALARRLIEPYLEDLEHKSLVDKNRVLRALAAADPAGALWMLEEKQNIGPGLTAQVKSEVVRALARTDLRKAEAIAAGITAPDIRAAALLTLCDALPASERDRKLALLNRAAALVRVGAPANYRLYQLGEVAERWYELGEKEEARTLFADGLRLANEIQDKTSSPRGSFAARLARVDLPSALAIARKFPAGLPYSVGWVLRNLAFRLAADDPAEAERVLRQIQPVMGEDWLPGAIAWKMAAVDPARARRLVEESQRHREHPEINLFLALGLKARDPAAARTTFETAMRGIDRLTQAGADYSRELAHRDILLPLVEQIDPALVPEYFWRVVAARPPLGNPRPISDTPQRNLVLLLAWYDRVVAEARL